MSRKNGFTVVEFLVVIGVLVVLLAMGAMAGFSLYPDYSLVSTTNKITSSFQLAKFKAIAQGIEYRVCMDYNASTRRLNIEVGRGDRTDGSNWDPDNPCGLDVSGTTSPPESSVIFETPKGMDIDFGGLGDPSVLEFNPNGTLSTGDSIIVAKSGNPDERCRKIIFTTFGRMRTVSGRLTDDLSNCVRE